MKVLLIVLLLNQIHNSMCISCCPDNFHLNKDLMTCISKEKDKSNLVAETSFNLTCDKRKIFKKQDVKILKDKSLLAYDTKYKEDEFCIDSSTDSVVLCPCNKRICVTACCPFGEIYNGSSDECEKFNKTEVTWNVHNITKLDETNKINLVYNDNLFKCRLKTRQNRYLMEYYYEGNQKFDYLIFSENSIQSYLHYGPTITKLSDDFCVSPVKSLWSDDIQKHVYNCETVVDHFYGIHYISYLYLGFFIIGSLFYLITLIIYAILPEKRKRVRDLSLMAYCACMFISMIAFGMNHLLSPNVYVHLTMCKASAFLSQYFGLASFIWMSLICLDIFLSITSAEHMIERDYSKELSTFVRYILISMLIPLIIVIITIAINERVEYKDSMHFHPGIHEDNDNIHCFIEGNAILIYYDGLLWLILVINILLFIYTMYTIFINRTRSLTISDSARHGKEMKDNVNLYIKFNLLIVFPWITELISWIVKAESSFWIIPDAYNILKSIIIFILFCCNKEICNALRKKLSCGNNGNLQI